MLLKDLLKLFKLNKKRRERVSLSSALYVKYIINIIKTKDDRTRNANNFSYTLCYIISIMRREDIVAVFCVRDAYNTRVLIMKLLIKEC